MAVGSGLLAAAALLIAVTLSFTQRPADPRSDVALVVKPADPHLIVPKAVQKTSNKIADEVPNNLDIVQADVSPLPIEPSPAEVDLVRGKLDLIGLLDRPEIRRWLVAVDPGEFDRVNREIDELVARVRLKHPARGRLEPTDGSAIDPDLAGRTVVHVLELGRFERSRLLAELLARVPEGSLRHDRPDSMILTALIEQDRLRVEEGPAVGIVRVPVGDSPAHSKKEAPLDRPIFQPRPGRAHGRDVGEATGPAETVPRNVEGDTPGVDISTPPSADEDGAPLLVWIVEKSLPASSKKAASASPRR